MKKNLIISISVIILILAGYYFWNAKKEKIDSEEQKQQAEEYLKEADQQQEVKQEEVEQEETKTVEDDPTWIKPEDRKIKMIGPKIKNNIVIRYGSPFGISSGGDARFNYYDINKGTFLDELNGYPWFWVIFDESDYESLHDFMIRKKYIFKITGQKDGDDCGYYDDGRCLENIWATKIEAVLEIETDIVRYKPPSILPKEVKNGECWTGSLALTQREDAWRCRVDNDIYDPCFSSTQPNQVVCFNSQEKEFILKLNQPLPKSDVIQTSENEAWKIEFYDGTICSAITGATFTVNDERANYACPDGSWLIGHPNNEKSLWTIKDATISSGEGDLESRIEEGNNIIIKKVWQ